MSGEAKKMPSTGAVHAPARDPVRSNKRSGLMFALVPVAMLALAYASVPLYRMFCQATGYGGTTQRAAAAPAQVLDRTVEVLFDANTSGGLPWTFEPVQRRQEVKLGETSMAFFRVTNRSARRLTGTATFNVDPQEAGVYFSKIQCFCFTEQTLEPGQSVEMPVTYFVDPGLATDKDVNSIGRIVLSYTFFEKAGAKAAAVPAGEAATPAPDNRAKGT